MEDSYIHPDEIPIFIRCFQNTEEAIANYKKYGPANPLINSFRDDEDYEFCPYANDGVCYMLTCECRKNEYDITKNESYNGKCNYVDENGRPCDVIFESKTEAWRTPLEEGGFNGWFCRDHFRRCIPRPKDTDEISAYHTLCDIMIMVREKYPVEEYESFNPDLHVEIYDPNEVL